MRSKAFFIAEGVAGMALLTVAAAVLMVAIGRDGVASRQLSDTRAAVRIAEQTLSNLQAGEPVSEERSSDVTIEIRPLASAHAPQGFRWAQVQATVAGRTRFLTGLVPAERSTP